MIHLETERLILRPFTADDAADVWEYLHEPAVNCFACMKLDTQEAAREAIKSRKDDAFYLAIVLKESGKVIGELFGHAEGTGPEDDTMDTFSPCWMLNRAYQGKGYLLEMQQIAVPMWILCLHRQEQLLLKKRRLQ